MVELPVLVEHLLHHCHVSIVLPGADVSHLVNEHGEEEDTSEEDTNQRLDTVLQLIEVDLVSFIRQQHHRSLLDEPIELQSTSLPVRLLHTMSD